MLSFFSKKFIWYKEQGGIILCGYCRKSYESFIPIDILFVCFQFYYAGWRRFMIRKEMNKSRKELLILEYIPFVIQKTQVAKIKVEETSDNLLDTFIRKSISKATNVNKKRLIITKLINKDYKIIKKISTAHLNPIDMSGRVFNLSEVPMLKTMIENLSPISSKPIKKSKIMSVEHLCMKPPGQRIVRGGGYNYTYREKGVRIAQPLLVRLPLNCKIKPGKIVKVIEKIMYPFLVMDEIKKFQQLHGKDKLPYYITMVTLTPTHTDRRYDYRSRPGKNKKQFNVYCDIPHEVIKGLPKCKSNYKGCALTENDNWKIKMCTLSDGTFSFRFAIQWHSERIGKKCYNHAVL
eukprot:364448_1